MLVLTRKNGEQLVIGRDVVVTVLAVNGGRVRLGIQAPGEVTVHRAEIALQTGAAVPEMALVAH